MSLLFMDSFELGTTPTALVSRYDANLNSTYITSSTTGVRTGTRTLGLQSNAGVTKNVTSTTTLIAGFAVYQASLTAGLIARFVTPGAANVVAINMTSAGDVTLTNGGSVVLTCVAAAAAAVSTYIQVKLVITSSGNGSATLVAGNVSQSGTFADAGLSSITGFTLIAFGQSYYDDFVLMDAGGTYNNDLPGRPKVECLRPTGAGSSTAMVATGASSNWQAVSDATPDGDASYVSSGTAGDADTYALADLASVSGYISAVQAVHVARKDDASARTLTTRMHLGGADYDGPAKALTTVYVPLADVYEVNPATSAQFTIADVNAMQAGPKVVS